MIPSPFEEQLIEHSPVAVLVLDRSGLVVCVNDAFLKLFGIRERAEAEGVLNLFTHPLVREHGFTGLVERAYRGEVVHAPAAPFRIPSRPPRIIRPVLFPVSADGGEVVNVVVMIEDVTDLHTSETALARRYMQIVALQEAFRTIGDAMTTDSALRSVLDAMRQLCNPDACGIWRKSPDGHWRCEAADGLSQSYRDAIMEAYDRAPPYWRAPLRVVQEDSAVIIEDTRTDPLLESIRHHVLDEGIGRILAAPMHSGAGVDGAILFYGREPGPFDPGDVDVALLLADQAAIALHNADLIEQANSAAAEARILYQTSAILTQSLSLTNVLRAITESVAPLMGFQRITVSIVDEERDEIRPIANTGVDPEAQSRWRADQPRRLSEEHETTRHLVATGEPVVVDAIGPELLATLTDEQRAAVQDFDIRSILIVALKEAGRVIGTMSFDTPGQARHWTERDVRLAEGVASQAAVALRNARLFDEARETRETLEERVRERTEKLRAAHSEVIASERLAAIGIMAREVAHGLRNPLNVISTSLYYLKSRFAEPDEKVTRHFETIARSVEQSANMINHLMNLAGPRQLETQPVDLNLLVQRALQDRFTAEEVRWDAEWDADLPYVQGDWTQISHAVKALIGNAASLDKNAPILIRTSRDGGMAILGVGDRRPHLTEERHRALFEPFFVSATEWTGLGLSVARQIATRHGGDVTVHEEDGVTWFCLTLPLVDAGAEP